MTLPTSGPLTFSDIQTEFGGSNPIGLNEYYAGGANVPAGTSGTYGAVPSSGQISVQNFYGTSDFVPVYIEDVFSTWLYPGNGTSQTIANGINLSANGGLVWIKSRNDTWGHVLNDTVRGAGYNLASDSVAAQSYDISTISGFTSSGFSVGGNYYTNINNKNFVSWTFREQPKFFDVVTYTGNGTAGRTVAHNLGSVPGCIIVKNTTAGSFWSVYHRSTGGTQVGLLNTDGGFSASSAYWNNTDPTSSVFTVGVAGAVNDSGQTYVAYLWAHDAGGFGAAGTDNVVSCGAFTATTNMSVNLGYEPQWLMFKKTSAAQDWVILDNMRTWSFEESRQLKPNSSDAENAPLYCTPTATGFSSVSGFDTGSSYIYVAIRRGPMKVPTVGTTVFSPQISDSSTTGQQITTNFPVDMQISGYNGGSVANFAVVDKLRSVSSNSTEQKFYLLTTTTAATGTTYNVSNNWNSTGYGIPTVWAGGGQRYWNFRRAPSFFDEVCYTGNSVQGRTITHNLGVTPELMIVKSRSNNPAWYVYNAINTATQYMLLNSDQNSNAASFPWNNTAPTSSVFTVQGTGGSGLEVNWTGYTYVAYLFATCAGVSKVGSYTGTGALQTVNCGFTTGSRFVLIKRTDSAGGWYVWDSARGISSGNDPYIRLESTAAEVTGTNYVDTTSVGFQVTAAAPAELNASGGTYIFLAIA